jgi:hypothetical protein
MIYIKEVWTESDASERSELLYKLHGARPGDKKDKAIKMRQYGYHDMRKFVGIVRSELVS